MIPRCGLVLLTGGRGERLGGPKHDRPHPLGGTWGGHLVSVFRAIVPEGPIHLVGAPLSDVPALPRLDDPREGPAVALRMWAASSPLPARRWWVLGCDQVGWTPPALEAWLKEAEPSDPAGGVWVMVEREGHRQPLGGFMGASLLPHISKSDSSSLHALMETVPIQMIPGKAWAGRDLDTPEDLLSFYPR